ncbi:sulfatase [Novipirellula artificiosorum]|uniref:Arylsulfatase n=1 Tax=Novipirellula artificiosorum TaxID=2528016 RepID=A0A5C6DLE5_9BACT|nr:sulfatase [Novipirellula artificiosorum]TWU38223.1 Arylsulfatase [Novipirellula artificiosorum]
MKKLLSFALLVCGLCGTTQALENPNIVLFFVDDLGWNNLGYRNPNLFETPNVDQLANDGIDFQQCYVASPTCSPSRSTLLTGKHPARLNLVRHISGNAKNVKMVYDEQGRASHHLLLSDPAQFPSKNWVDLENVTYAEALKSHGYYNLFVGKWHLGPKEFHPIHQGFDRQIGTTDHGSPSSYYPDYFQDEDVLEEQTEAYLTDKLTDETIHFIDGYDEDQPFMVSMWYYNVHTPNIGRKDLVPRFKGRAGLEGKRAQYAAQVAAVDESVGRIRTALKDKGIDKNTLVIFTSDQGSLYEWEPYRGGKRVDTLCEGGARVPFIVSWPGVTERGVTNNSIIQTTDVLPTLVELVGGNPADYGDLDGVSLFSTLRDNTELQRDKPIYGYRAYEDLYVSVREGDWKLLGYRDGRVSLYNVVDDRSEQDDLANTNPEKVQLLLEKLKAWEVEMDVQQYSGFQ